MYCEQALELKHNGDYSGAVQLYQKELKHFYAHYQQYGGGPAYAAQDEYNKCFPSLTLKYDEWTMGNVYYALGKAFYLNGEYDKAVASYLLNINSFIKDDYDMKYALLRGNLIGNEEALKYHVTLNTISDIRCYPILIDKSRDIVRHLGHALKDRYVSDTDIAIQYKNAISGGGSGKDMKLMKPYDIFGSEEEEYREIGNESWVSHIAYLCDVDISVPFEPDMKVEIQLSKLLKTSLLFRDLILD